ncbi:MAG: hypothetical protein AMJ54_05335 [Deltaproteobacteria bacterium SG8_13]|nr:MAG: hypothetical protein AMJ54_05335 [Deltaproteobacteria bacterium SG8_13]
MTLHIETCSLPPAPFFAHCFATLFLVVRFVWLTLFRNFMEKKIETNQVLPKFLPCFYCRLDHTNYRPSG